MSTKMSQMIVDKKTLKEQLTKAEETITTQNKEIKALKASNAENDGQSTFWQEQVEQKEAIIKDKQ